MASQIQLLHVDDDPSFLDLTADVLERRDDRLRVDTATSPVEALAELEGAAGDRDGVECVIVDYQMPEMDGIEFLERVRETRPDLPVILFTGRGSEEVAAEAISAGATDYLQKSPGGEAFSLLANRVINAVERARAERRAHHLERIREVRRAIDQVLVRATSRAEIEERACEIIASARPYRFAWIGEIDDDMTIRPRVGAGVEAGYLDQVEITADDRPTGRGPTGEAVRTGEIRTTQDVTSDPDYEPWRRAAVERGYRSSAAVPLEHDGTTFGVLNVYADRANAFDARERGLLRELGDDMAHALRRVDLYDRLTSFERAIEAMPIGFVRLRGEAGRTIETANPAMAALLGADDPASIEGRRFDDLVDDRAAWAQCLDRLQRDGSVDGRRLGLRRQSGSEEIGPTSVETSFTAVRTEGSDGAVVHALLRNRTVDGIADGRGTDDVPGRPRDRFEAMIEHSPDMVFIHDGDGIITRVNRRTCEKLGYDREEIEGKAVWDVDLTVDVDNVHAFWENLGEDETPMFEGTYEDSEGATIPVEIHLSRLDADGDRFLAIVRDVTARKRRERDLHQRTDELERQNDRLAEFVDILAHDIPNHLTVAAGRLGLAEQTGEQIHLDAVATAHERIATIVEDMETLVRQGTRVDATEATSLEDVADACWRNCCQVDGPASLEFERDVRLEADVSRLKQLLENLFWNAREHVGPDVTVRIGPLEDGFYVEDDGPGISPAERESAFSPGFSTVEGDHSGFGLTIVREIAHAHGWRVAIVEAEGGGTRFEFRGVPVDAKQPAGGSAE